MEPAEFLPRYTIDDLDRFQDRFELWDGRLVARTPRPFNKHQQLAMALTRHLLAELDAAGCGDCGLLAEPEWVISRDMSVIPDLALVCGEVPETFLNRAPELIIEVLSDSTHLKDRNLKRGLYADQGVDAYLLADPKTGRLEPMFGGEVVQGDCGEAFRVSAHAGCELKLPMQM